MSVRTIRQFPKANRCGRCKRNFPTRFSHAKFCKDCNGKQDYRQEAK